MIVGVRVVRLRGSLEESSATLTDYALCKRECLSRIDWLVGWRGKGGRGEDEGRGMEVCEGGV